MVKASRHVGNNDTTSDDEYTEPSGDLDDLLAQASDVHQLRKRRHSNAPPPVPTSATSPTHKAGSPAVAPPTESAKKATLVGFPQPKPMAARGGPRAVPANMTRRDPTLELADGDSAILSVEDNARDAVTRQTANPGAPPPPPTGTHQLDVGDLQPVTSDSDDIELPLNRSRVQLQKLKERAATSLRPRAAKMATALRGGAAKLFRGLARWWSSWTVSLREGKLGQRTKASAKRLLDRIDYEDIQRELAKAVVATSRLAAEKFHRAADVLEGHADRIAKQGAEKKD